MTALPAIALPPDPTPPSRATDNTADSGGTHFFSLVQNGQNSAPPSDAAATDTSGNTATSPAATVSANGPPAKGLKGSGSNGNSDGQGNSATGGNGTSTATAVVIPLPVPLVLTQPAATPPAGAAAAAAPSLGGVSATPGAQDGSAPSNPAALMTAAAALNAASGGALPAASATAPQPAATPAAIAAATKNIAVPAATGAQANGDTNNNGNSAASTSASASASTSSAAPNAASTAAAASGTSPQLPAMAATLGMRVAANAVMFVSQPRAAMASFTPQAEATQGKAGADASNSPTSGTPSSSDTGHAPSSTADASNDQASSQAIASAAKNGVGVAPPPDHGASDQLTSMAAQAPINAASAANNAAAAAQVAAAPSSPAQTAAPMATSSSLPMPTPAASEQVALSLHQAVKGGNDYIQIQLQPADLGAVAVKLNINHDGHVTMVVSADRSDTLNMLKQDASSLTQALRDAGLQADNSSLSFNLRGGYQFNQQQQSGNGGTSLSTPYSNGAVDDLAAAAPSPSMLSSHSGSLDIHV